MLVGEWQYEKKEETVPFSAFLTHSSRGKPSPLNKGQTKQCKF